jgi:hypothetical protein
MAFVRSSSLLRLMQRWNKRTSYLSFNDLSKRDRAATDDLGWCGAEGHRPNFRGLRVALGLRSRRAKSAGVAKRPRELISHPKPLPFRLASNEPHGTAMKKKLRIVRLGFGTARQKRVLECWTNPKPLQPIWDRAAI